MTRAKSDTIIGIVGAVAIVLALVGVFVYEYNNVDDGDGMTEPPIASESFEGNVAADGTAIETFTPDEGVSAIQISIAWTPTAPGIIAAAANYEYELAAPDGTVIDSGSSAGASTIDVAVQEAGVYTLTISAPSPSQGGAYTADASYDY